MSKTRDTATAEVRPLNARSLALSILLGSHPPSLPARAIVSFGELFGVAGGTMRTALSRMTANGEITSEDGRYQLAGHLLQRQRAQDEGRVAPATTWDGRWHSIIAANGQREVSERRRFRSLMADHRFGELRPDIWMRPNNLVTPRVGHDWIVTTAHVEGVDHTQLARMLWDLDEIAAAARRMRSELATLRRGLDWTDHASIPPIFTTSASVVRFLRSEPLLPRALAPRDWPVDPLREDYDEVEHGFRVLLRDFLRSA